MKYPKIKIEIEHIGTFTVPPPVWDLLAQITGERDGLRAEAERLRAALANERDWTVAFAGDVKAEMDRADAAEAEVKRLRAIMAETREDTDWMQSVAARIEANQA